MAERALNPVSAVQALTADLRGRILDGELEPGRRLVERELQDDYGVARHTIRSALRDLSAEGLVRLEANRGARVADLDDSALRGLFDLRMAIELEACHRMLEADGGPSDDMVAAVERLSGACRRRRPAWRTVVDAHEEVHTAIVRGGHSARLAAEYTSLQGEIRLFVVALRPAWGLARMARHHEALLGELRAEGVPALRRHLEEGRDSVLSAYAGSSRPSQPS